MTGATLPCSAYILTGKKHQLNVIVMIGLLILPYFLYYEGMATVLYSPEIFVCTE